MSSKTMNKCYHMHLDFLLTNILLIDTNISFAGWSSQVARRAHNPKVGGSNPPPATK